MELWAGFTAVEEEAGIHLSEGLGMYPLIVPSSDVASSSNWPTVGVDGVKMSASPFTSVTAACQLHGRVSEHA